MLLPLRVLRPAAYSLRLKADQRVVFAGQFLVDDGGDGGPVAFGRAGANGRIADAAAGEAALAAAGIRANLVRLSAGIECREDLVADVLGALEAACDASTGPAALGA